LLLVLDTETTVDISWSIPALKTAGQLDTHSSPAREIDGTNNEK
jgi:hypothetical protein